jgi:hypothetical protein
LGSSRFFVEHRAGEDEGVWVVVDKANLSTPLFIFDRKSFAVRTVKELNGGEN